MILKAKHHYFIYNFFQLYGIYLIKKKFHSVNFNGKIRDEKLPVIVLSNHISWWDGFWIMYFNRKILKRKFYFMMLEDQLRKHWYFNYCGGFSVNKNSKSLIESLKYCIDLLEHTDNMVLLFPQGEIKSMHMQNIEFQKGIEYILHNCSNNIQILFIANIIDYFSNPKPTLNIYFEEYTEKAFEIKNLEEAYNKFYLKSINTQITLNK
jgi:1-acyl-sn-glycerol-3-phosphate acyltransferase